MGIFDIFGTGDQTAAAQAQIAGINAGTQQATGNINSGIGAINSGYTAALQPYLQNQATANAGTTQLGNVLGLNGAAGGQTALQTLQATPGYQFQQQQGDAGITAADAASGKTSSGNDQIALSNYNQNLAGTTYNNYVSQLQPYLGASNNAAAGAASVNTGQANALAGQYGNLANLNYTSQTGIGNANANADLAGLTASGNIMNLIGSIGGAALGGLGGLSGGSLGSLIGGAVPGAQGPSSVGGAPLSNSLYSSIFSGLTPSDERLKDDVEEVGALADGQPVYKYRYVGSPVFQIGLMAQDVEKTHPEAVGDIGGGFKGVDYGKATQYAADLSRFLDAA